MSQEEIDVSIREMLAADDCIVEHGNESVIYKLKITKSGQKHGKTATIKNINEIISNNGFALDKENSDKKTFILEPEKKYIRRTADDFRAGAEPVRGSGSHRLSTLKVTTTGELERAVKEAADASGVKFTIWARAAFRKALREGMDIDFELNTAVEVPAIEKGEPS